MKHQEIERPTLLEVSLDNIAHNTRFFKSTIGSTELMAVVKANAYGHGVMQIARTCLENGASWLGVATVEEGLELRNGGFDAPILVFCGILPGQIPVCKKYGLDITIQDKYFLENFKDGGIKLSGPINAHLKIDTGMHRLGVFQDEITDFLIGSKQFPEINIRGIWTQFPEAGAQDKSFTKEQIRLFDKCVKLAESVLGREIEYKHAANSTAIINHKDSHYNIARPGLGLYGYHDGSPLFDDADILPAIRWVSKIISIRDLGKGESISYGRTYTTKKPLRVATIPLGYADGYNRLNSNCGQVLFRGVKTKILGRVCMDQTMIDITGFENVRQGEEVVVLGKQGSSEISIYDMQSLLGTIPYEILVNISSRVKRVYI